MQPSSAQKGIKVLSILAIIFGILGVIFAFMAIAGGALIGSEPGAASDTAQELGITSADVGFLAVLGGLLVLFSAALNLLLGILGLRAAKDNQKIMPVWILSLISLVVAVASTITSILNGLDSSQIVSAITGLIIPVLFFWFANTVKQEAGR